MTREKTPQKSTKPVERVPYVPNELKEQFFDQLPKIRRDVSQIKKHFEIFKISNPDLYDRIAKKHSAFFQHLESILLISGAIEDLSAQKLRDLIDYYNSHAHAVNTLLGKIALEDQQEQELLFMQESSAKDLIERQLSMEEKRQLKQLAMDVWDELFPKTYTDKFVLYMLGKKGGRVTGASKIAAAPMNGIEGTLRGIVGLFNPQTYVQVAKSISVITKMSMKDWGNIYLGAKKIYENISTEDKIAPIISLITSLVFLVGGTTKLSEIAKKMGYSQRIIKTALALRTIGKITSFSRVLPTAAITGIVLPYIV